MGQRGKGLKLHQKRFWLDIRENFFTKRLSNSGTGCPGRQWSPCPWRALKDLCMWHLGMWFIGGLGGAGDWTRWLCVIVSGSRIHSYSPPWRAKLLLLTGWTLSLQFRIMQRVPPRDCGMGHSVHWIENFFSEECSTSSVHPSIHPPPKTCSVQDSISAQWWPQPSGRWWPPVCSQCCTGRYCIFAADFRDDDRPCARPVCSVPSCPSSRPVPAMALRRLRQSPRGGRPLPAGPCAAGPGLGPEPPEPPGLAGNKPRAAPLQTLRARQTLWHRLQC